jgi:serine/threonine-protein kinase
MIQPNGNAILIDFGIAKEIIPASSSSTDYAANPSFAPYEQIYKGSKANRQPSVDIYALAASFYYAVTGQKPTPSMERRLDNRPLKSPKEINRNLSEHLDTAITLGMALEKENRPQSMSDWLQKLELPPPPVEPQYRQETVNPPEQKKEPEEPKQKATFIPKSSENSLQKKFKNLPWGWLMGVFLIYGSVSYFLGVTSAPWQVWAGAVAGAVAVAGAWAVAGLSEKTSIFDRWKHQEWIGAFLFLVFPGLVGGITFSLMSGNVFVGIITGIGSIAIVFTQFYTAFALYNKNFSPFNIFRILTVTNLSGFGSGWLLGFLLHSKG